MPKSKTHEELLQTSEQRGRCDNKITNWYEKTGAGVKKNPMSDPTFKRHYIESPSHILSIGPTGDGKTNGLYEFLSRKGGNFGRIIIFTGTTEHEHLYDNLRNKNPSIEFFTNIDELPSFQNVKEDEFDKDASNLIVFDDFINLPKKKLNKMCDWVIAGRKMGFSCYLMTQNYTDVPTQIRRNISYFFIGRQKDISNLKYILKQHSFGMNKDLLMQFYEEATNEPFSFFMIDTKTLDPHLRFRKNYLGFFL